MSDEVQNEMIKSVKSIRLETGFSLEQISEALYDIILDEISLGICFSIHRDAKTGALEAEGLDDSVPPEFCIVDKPGLDVLGQPLVMKRPPDAKCPVCGRSIACTRFAPHLEKCVGMGRNSSRLASRRIASSHQADGVSDDDDDDWATGGDQRRKKQRRDKLSPRRPKALKKNGLLDKDSDTKSNPSNPSSSPSTPEQAIQYEQLTEQERRTLFNQVCGVITESTRHMCTRSVRCQQHSDGQRRSVRVALFGTEGGAALLPPPSGQPPLEGSALKDSLNRIWERASRGSSPADSNSTTNSTNSVHVGGRQKKKRGRVKKIRVQAQPSVPPPPTTGGI